MPICLHECKEAYKSSILAANCGTLFQTCDTGALFQSLPLQLHQVQGFVCLPAPCRINVAGAGIQEYNCEKVVLIIQRSLCLPALYITFHFLHSFLRWPVQRAVNASRAQHHRASFLSQKAFYQLNTERTQNCVWHPFRQMCRMKSAL